MSNERVRVSVDLPRGDTELLKAIAERSGFNVTSTLVRAIRVLDDIDRTVRDGGRVILEHDKRHREQLILKDQGADE